MSLLARPALLESRSISPVDQWHDHVHVSSPIPLHAQLRRILELHLVNDAYRIDDPLPSESQLASRFNLSRATVRRAIESLEADGWVRRRQGLRTVLTRLPPADQQTSSLVSYEHPRCPRADR